MGIRNFQVISIETDGSINQAVAASGVVAIPSLIGTSANPKYVHIRAMGATGILIGDAISVTPDVGANDGAFATGFILSPFYWQEIILNVHGYTHIGFDEVGSALGSIQITPLADF